MVREKTFREDLYYRLHVIPLHIPPLRNRSVDIVPLALHFLEQFNTMYAKDRQLSREAVEVLENYPWPGNIRELQNVMERLVVTAKSDFIEGTDVLRTLYEGSLQAEHLHESVIQDVIPLKEAVEQVEAELISLSLQKYKTAAEAARALEISEPTMSRKLKKYFPFRKE